MSKYFSLFLLFTLVANLAFSQKHIIKPVDSTDITFTGTKINPYSMEYDTTGKLQINGYLDTYYAYYSDSSNINGYAKFPTIAPRKNQISMNILQLSVKYNSNLFHGTITIFGGDCPKSSWSEHLNFIQEANIGFKIVKKLWLDAGFFRTHIGLESIQPRENMTMSLATTTYFEPYFLSGIKLTWQQSEKLAIQLNAFNSFNQFLETNKNKAVGFSVAYAPNKKISSSLSSIICDETSLNVVTKHLRLYNNLCVVYKDTKLIIGLEGNFGLQKNSVLVNFTKTAFVYSSLISMKYRFTPKWSSYVRGEFFNDKNEVLTGPVISDNHNIVGVQIYGITHGYEFKPIPNSYFRVECRYLNNYHDNIFYIKSNPSYSRFEFIAGLGLWF